MDILPVYVIPKEDTNNIYIYINVIHIMYNRSKFVIVSLHLGTLVILCGTALP